MSDKQRDAEIPHECRCEVCGETMQQTQSELAPARGSANLAAFGKDVLERLIDHYREGWPGEDDEEMTEIAFKYGLVEKVIYDPDKHGEIQEAEPGNEIWWFGSGEDSQNV